jgi:hypothetical protein
MHVKTVDPEIRSEAGSTAGEPKNVSRVIFKVRESRGLLAGPDEGNLVYAKQFPPTRYGDPLPLHTGEIAMVLPGKHREEGSIVFEQRDPLPLTVLALTTWVSIG